MKTPLLKLLKSSYGLSLRVATMTANLNLTFPGEAGATGQALRLKAGSTEELEWFTPTSGSGSGTVTSVALTAPSFLSVGGSPVTTAGTLALTLANQTANTVFAAPDSTTGAPTFRALIANDIPVLDAAKIASGTIAIARIPVGTASGTVAAGNDARFHTQNTDTGTTAQSFQLNSGSSGSRIKANGTAIEARNAADSAYVDLVCQNLTVNGTTTTINSNTVNIGDNILTLNSDYAGSAPTENGGLEVQRGTLTNASLIWDESTDDWKIGLLGSEYSAARVRRFTFTSATLSSGVLALTHNLGNKYVTYAVYLSDDTQIFPDATATSSNILTLDFSDVTIAGTANVVVTG